MDNNTPEQATTASALDKVAAALATLGEETAAAIATQAGVGYSTATKRLRVLEEAGQAEPFRADDGRTLWRHLTNTTSSTDSDDRPAADTNPPHPQAPDSGADDAPERPEEPPAPPQDAGATAAVGQGDETAGAQPDDGHPPASDNDADQPTSQNPPDNTVEDVPTEPAEVGSEGDDTATPAAEDDAVAVEADSDHVPQPTAAGHPAPAGGPAEVPPASSGKPRRPKGSLRGAILDVLEAHPGQSFKTSQLCLAVDTANEGSGAAKASAGAVVNAVHKLVAAGVAVQVAEKPATFRLAARTD
ncbi:MarR family transcriptional regulator [Micromonospora sp. NPDC047134]|uniref:MarR family transcriptional regulator n=1 Tax=Micromonospora sp. NPDC047134 TaxID=3154340 RepID=UPI0033C24797